MDTEKKVDPRAALVNGLKGAADKQSYLDDLEKGLDESKNAITAEFLAAVYGSGVADMKIEANAEKSNAALEKGVQFGSTTCIIAKGEKTEDPAKAAEYFNSALDAGDFRAANSLGVIALRSGDLTEALAKFELAASHKVDRAHQNLLITRMQAAMNAQQQAFAYMQKAISVFAARPPPSAEKEKETTEEKKE